MSQKKGYTLLALLVAITIMGIGLLVAIPVWQTQIQREKEVELIFRGHQYVEAIRIYQMLYPGSFPKTLEELLEEKCIRKLFPDPMTKDGEWNLILPYQGVSTKKGTTPQKVLIVPTGALASIDNPRIIGVVSSSTRRSFKIYQDQEFYNTWLFFYGQDPKKLPEIVHYGKEEENR
jgi:type II secretory pathway pseudopilin PulG